MRGTEVWQALSGLKSDQNLDGENLVDIDNNDELYDDIRVVIHLPDQMQMMLILTKTWISIVMAY